MDSCVIILIVVWWRQDQTKSTHSVIRGSRAPTLWARFSKFGSEHVMQEMRSVMRVDVCASLQVLMSPTALRMAWLQRVSWRAQISRVFVSIMLVMLAGGGGRLVDSMQ